MAALPDGIAVATGGLNGIGAATAQRLAAEGVSVAVNVASSRRARGTRIASPTTGAHRRILPAA